MTSLRRTRPRRARLTALIASAMMISASLIVIDVGDADRAEASHFRANQTTWARTSADKVQFTLVNSFRASYYPVDTVGDTFGDGTFSYGDGSSDSLEWTAIAVDLTNDIVTGRVVLEHTYATSGPFWASQDNCCRLGTSNGHINNPDGDITMRTLVDLSQPASPSSAVSPIVGCPLDALCTFTMPAANPTSGTTRFRLADASDGFGVQPPGATIDPTTGLYSWDTTGVTTSPDPTPTFYSTQVIVESWNGQNIVGSISVDFFIQVGGTSANQAPVFVTPTPADGSVIAGSVGAPLVFSVAATDADDDHIVLSIINLPADATYTQTVDEHGSAGAEFTWTPTEVGSHYVILTAMDSRGLSATQRTITLSVAQASSTTAPPTTQPPVTDPPVTQPPTTQPPVTEPPVTSTTTARPTTTTVTETTTPATTTAADPTTTLGVVVSPRTTPPAPRAEADHRPELARTGSNLVALGLLGAGLALAGGVVISSRRRLS